MNKLRQITAIIRANPRFSLMRTVSRFASVRWLVRNMRRLALSYRTSTRRRELIARLDETMFKDVNHAEVARVLKRDGVAFGLQLPANVVTELRIYAENAVLYADREPDKGFRLKEKLAAENALNKEILVAQYLNAEAGCELIRRLRTDPLLELVALEYLGSDPKHVGTNMWWTFPVNASEEDRTRHAHVYHYDLDDFSFVKFFFYLTDVDSGDGAHVCVATSHLEKPHLRLRDHFLVRRYTDEEVERYYSPEKVLRISGAAGTGFAEDTLCIHKGATPTKSARLLLQFQFALFDYGVQRDEVPQDQLALIV